ncbi:MAG TPA: hypothetical protein VHX66_05335 [Solirubrobacteraceae bacterium]|jgi:hypothetical protein|nr:hypothetical protein [Solirubrobacteraceae bacterium]
MAPQPSSTTTRADLPKPYHEGLELLHAFYGFDDPENEDDHLAMAVDFRRDTTRLVIFNFALAIEDVLKSLLYYRLNTSRAVTAAATKRYVQDMGTHDAIALAARLKIVNKDLYRSLVDLNRLRNKAAHEWLLDSYRVVRLGAGSKRKRTYRLEWLGTRLTPERMKHEFIPFYGDVYLTLFAAFIRRRFPAERGSRSARA